MMIRAHSLAAWFTGGTWLATHCQRSRQLVIVAVVRRRSMGVLLEGVSPNPIHFDALEIGARVIRAGRVLSVGRSASVDGWVVNRPVVVERGHRYSIVAEDPFARRRKSERSVTQPLTLTIGTPFMRVVLLLSLAHTRYTVRPRQLSVVAVG
jgi:hypothetical protein